METFKEFEGKDLILAGDGRMDSPGHCAMYCTYTLAETETKKILSIQTRDVRQAEGSSANMELKAFEIAFHEIYNICKDFQSRIVEIITDAHSGIKALLGKSKQCLFSSFEALIGK